MASRAFLGKAKAQVLPYSSKKGAIKIVQAVGAESLYGVVVILNDSAETIIEDFIFDKLQGFTIVGKPKGTTKFQVVVEKGKSHSILMHRNNTSAAAFHFKTAL